MATCTASVACITIFLLHITMHVVPSVDNKVRGAMRAPPRNAPVRSFLSRPARLGAPHARANWGWGVWAWDETALPCVRTGT